MDIFATALPALGEAFSLIVQPQQIMFLMVGVLLGLSVGVLPGLGGIAGLSLVLPFIFGMDPVSGLALMVGLVAVVPTSDTFASVLLGIPGSTASQATVLDGFPLSKKGEAARALSAAFASSLFGGILGAIVLTFFLLIARPLILAFGLPEMLMITVLGLSMVAILAGRIPLKGVAAAGLGLMVGTIGESDVSGSLRMATYDMPYLVEGFKLVIVGLGIFAVPEIVALLRQDRAISRSGGLGSGWGRGVRDWFANIWLSIRCSGLGVIIGVIPGLGGSVVDWITYGFTVQASKDKSGFGRGDIRGVIGPESSNNAKEGGGLVPTVIFGIPGSGSMAVFLGGIALLGYDPGPHMVRHNLDLTYTIVWSLALANVFAAGLCILLSNQIAKITTIRFTLVAPFLFMVIAFAAFQSSQMLADLVALIGIGILGILLRRFDWSRPAFLIGFVLAGQAEAFANQAVQISTVRFARDFWNGMGYIATPITLTILALTIVSVWLGIRQGKQVFAGTADPPSAGKRAPILFLLAVTAYVAVAVWDASQIGVLRDKIFPVTVGIVTLAACGALMAQMIRAPVGHPIFADAEAGGEDAGAPHGLWATLGWFVYLLAMSAVLGFILAIGIFFLTFLRIRAGLGWRSTWILTAAAVALMIALGGILGREFPPGLLQSLVELPWPLGGDRDWIYDTF